MWDIYVKNQKFREFHISNFYAINEYFNFHDIEVEL